MSTVTAPQRRLKRRRRVRAKVRGSAERPRISVFRSSRGVFAQLIDDDSGRTLAAVQWTESDLRSLKPMEQATSAGKLLAERAKAAGVESVVFDRGGYQYDGRVKGLAEGAREGGLIFYPRRTHASPRSIHLRLRLRPPGTRRRDQPRRQGRQGRPALLVHRAGRRRRRERRGRRRLRQGQ